FRSGGRAMYASGWVPVVEIEKIWQRCNRNHIFFEIEQMGSRPSSYGYVVRDKLKYAVNRVEEPPHSFYVPAAPVSICVDWGTNAAGIVVWQALWFDTMVKHLLLEAEQIEGSGILDITSKIQEFVNKYI